MSSFSTYPDWVRVGAIDTAPLDVNDLAATYVGGNVVYGGFDCTNWTGLAGVLANNGAAEMTATFIWYSDPNATQPVAQRMVNIAGGAQASFNHPNVAPWVQVTVQSQAAGSLLLSAVMWRTNRVTPWPYVPLTPFMYAPFSNSINNGVTLTIVASYVYAGAVGYRFSSGTAAGLWQFRASNGSNGFQTFHQETVASGSTSEGVLDFPEAVVELQIQNTGAAVATYVQAVWPVATGSR